MQTTSAENQVKCPQCGHEFSVGAALEKELTIRLRKEIEADVIKKEASLKLMADQLEQNKQQLDQLVADALKSKQSELEQKIKKQAAEEFAAQINSLKEQSTLQNQQIQEFRKKQVELSQKEEELNKKAENAELQMKEELLKAKEAIKKDAEEMANKRAELLLKEKEESLKDEKEKMHLLVQQQINDAIQKTKTDEQMKQAELLKKLEDQSRLVDELKRKQEQGSMQMQGEVMELELEQLLRESFPIDIIEEVPKGFNGADCIQIVRDTMGNEVGKIIYESKRTKAFTKEWTEKLKQDMRAINADLAVIVTQVLPEGMTRFGLYQGVWVCTFEDVKSVSMVMRDSLIRIQSVVIAQHNKGDKMSLLYDYLTGVEFRQKVEAIVEGFTQMQIDMISEKRAMEGIWKKRAKQLEKVILNTNLMYSSIRGIGGNAIGAIKALELEAPEDDVDADISNDTSN